MSPGISQNRWAGRREREAEDFEAVATAIDNGTVTIKNADPEVVRARLLDKAARSRAGERVAVIGASYSLDSSPTDEDEDLTSDPL